MRFAYADPPYIGQAKRHYGDHPDYGGEVDHVALVGRLRDEYPDGWALSLSTPTLKTILALCPDDVRVLAWVKPFTPFRKGSPIVYAWEPVIVRGGRPRHHERHPFVFDWLKADVTLKRKVGLAGAKPESFCFWLFDVLNAKPGDTLDDLFPGTGGVTRAWLRYMTRLPLVTPEPATQTALSEVV